ncbi:VOC family protein [Leptospira sp. WS58.C1]|uniref:VOC family protein n=1 Tax=Leptospira TaxID=171 RepID=UPI0002BFE84C|nr:MULTISPECIES: VOC family protein [unclassified Leptospira]EMJ99449.1 glyoxalase-like domain protein [Leptospira sp. B5-022]MCR1795680.1 VOC family protein [Leptospira sp. id769339]
MKKMITNLIAAILALSLLQCVNKQNKMNSYISIFEIPAKDLKKAITFYESILDIKIEKMELQGIKMGVLPYENQQVTGLIVEAQGYEPSTNGITVYLNAGEDLQIILDKIVKNGGKILIPKTPHADGNGFFAIFIDSEGNKMGLNSEK